MARLICPIDGAELIRTPDSLWTCGHGHGFPEQDGVICMLPQRDEFYEGAYLNHVKFCPKSDNLIHCWPLWLMCNGYPWVVRKHVPISGQVLELGCAGGVDYFASRFSMIGLDLSRKSLASASITYSMRIQADASKCIPFADESIDTVISSYFWEHISPNVKDSILAECHRVLKPSGKIIFLYDIETNNPLIRFFKRRSPAKYQELFLDGDGHIGYETPVANITHFTRAKFSVVEQKYLEKTPVQSPSVYNKLSQFPSISAKIFRTLDKLAAGRFYYPYTAIVRICDTVFSHILPNNWARITITVARKETASKASPS